MNAAAISGGRGHGETRRRTHWTWVELLACNSNGREFTLMRVAHLLWAMARKICAVSQRANQIGNSTKDSLDMGGTPGMQFEWPGVYAHARRAPIMGNGPENLRGESKGESEANAQGDRLPKRLSTDSQMFLRRPPSAPAGTTG